MPRGKLEVLLIGAKSLEDADVLGKMDPYVILICRTQEQRSSVATGHGNQPRWNENFVFTITDDDNTNLRLKIMDSDVVTDDFVGEATIPLEPVFVNGSLPSTPYNVVKDDRFCGEIRVSLTFTPEHDGHMRHRHGNHANHSAHHATAEIHHGGSHAKEESYGGWKESSHNY